MTTVTPKNLVLEGGGVRGMAYIGALQVLNDHDLLKEVTRFAGSSAGAIVAGALAVGYTPDELKKILTAMRFDDFMDDSFGWFRDIYRLFKEYGIHKGDAFLDWYGGLLAQKTGSADITFEQVYTRYHKVLVITGACLNKKEVHYYHYLTNPKMPIRKAIRISMSIPIFFKAVWWQGDLLVDGGILDNYPLHVFDSPDLPDSKNKKIRITTPNPETLGLKLMEPKELPGEGSAQVDQTNTPVTSLIGFLKALVGTWWGHIENLQIDSNYWDRTIPISTSGIPTTKFDLTSAEQELLYQNGVAAVQNYIIARKHSTEEPDETKVKTIARGGIPS